MKHRVLLIILALLLFFPAHSRPARKGVISLMQPDGTVLSARISGDEFIRVTTTLEGNALVQDKDGWWCYAEFDENGHRRSSGWKAGTPAPAAVISGSRRVPYEVLSDAAGRRRSSAYGKTFSDNQGVLTKDGSAAVKHGLVILAQFSDIKFKYGRQDFLNLLTSEGYSRNGASGSARKYFDDQFAGKMEFKFDVSEVVTLPGKRSDYGSNLSSGEDKDPARMVIEACQSVDSRTDFTLYDDDNDGEIDNVFIFFAGGDEAEGAGEDCIWSHSWYIYNGAEMTVTLDGKKLNRYACSSGKVIRRQIYRHRYILSRVQPHPRTTGSV